MVAMGGPLFFHDPVAKAYKFVGHLNGVVFPVWTLGALLQRRCALWRARPHGSNVRGH